MQHASRPDTWRGPAATLGIWTLFGLLESSKAYVADQLQGIPRGWGPALVGNMPWWWTWAALTPLVFLLAGRFRLDRRGWPAALGVHVVLATAVSSLHLAAVGVLYWHTITRPVLAYLPAAARERVASPLGQVEAFLNGYLIVDVMTYAGILAAWYALRFHRAMREREREAMAQRARAAALEAQMHEARLSALRMELNPHFLYNALNAIAGLVRRGDEAHAIEMLARLGTLLRLTLDRDRGHEATLAGELDLLDLYLAIERTRFGDRLHVDLEVAPTALDALVPAFVLQPLVENAIRHGIAATPGPGWLRIGATERDGTLRIEIADTGPGIQDVSGQGIGLRNTRARLAQLYGEDAGLALERGATGGTIATLWLPYRRATPIALDQEPYAHHALA